jgi:hypothetical protein
MARQNERYGFCGRGVAVAKFPHQGFGRVGERLKPGQAKKSESPFDVV